MSCLPDDFWYAEHVHVSFEQSGALKQTPNRQALVIRRPQTGPPQFVETAKYVAVPRPAALKAATA